MRKFNFAFFLAAIPMIAFAQAPDQGEAVESWIMVVVNNAGIAGWSTLAMSVGAFTIVIKLFMESKPEKLVPPSTYQHVSDLIGQQDYEGAVNSVSADQSFLGRVLYGGLSRMNGGAPAVERGAGEAWDGYFNNMIMTCSYVQLCAQLAPMLGLFGTISGMMDTFAVLAHSSGAANPKQLAVGIMYALVTTFIGLMVAIPSNICYLFLRNRIVSASLEVSQRTSEIFDTLFVEGGEEAKD